MLNPAQTLLHIVTEHFGAFTTPAAEAIDAVILRDLRPDSLDVVELIMAIEDGFGIEIADDEIMALPETTTLRDVLGLVEGKLDGKKGIAA